VGGTANQKVNKDEPASIVSCNADQTIVSDVTSGTPSLKHNASISIAGSSNVQRDVRKVPHDLIPKSYQDITTEYAMRMIKFANALPVETLEGGGSEKDNFIRSLLNFHRDVEAQVREGVTKYIFEQLTGYGYVVGAGDDHKVLMRSMISSLELVNSDGEVDIVKLSQYVSVVHATFKRFAPWIGEKKRLIEEKYNVFIESDHLGNNFLTRIVQSMADNSRGQLQKNCFDRYKVVFMERKTRNNEKPKCLPLGAIPKWEVRNVKTSDNSICQGYLVRASDVEAPKTKAEHALSKIELARSSCSNENEFKDEMAKLFSQLNQRKRCSV
jgi:hypothetical protein